MKNKAAEDAVAKLKSHEKKIAKARNLLDADADSLSSVGSIGPMTTRSGRYMARSETDLTTFGKTPTPAPRNGQHYRGATTAYMPIRQTATRNTRGAAPPTKPVRNEKSKNI